MLKDNQQIIDTSHSGLELALKKHLSQAQMPAFDNYLLNKILNRLAFEQELQGLKPRLALAAGIFASGLTALVAAFIFSIRSFAQTSTFHYLSLAFTDSKLIATNWQDYSLSVLENLPLGAVALMLGGILGSILLVDFSVKRFGGFKKLAGAMHFGFLRN